MMAHHHVSYEWADSTDSYVASASEIDRPAVENLLREMLEILETNLSEVFKRFDALEGLLKSSPARKELRKLQNHLDLFELDNVRIDLENISRGLNILL
jgi:histidyl-tRNA synthetase